MCVFSACIVHCWSCLVFQVKALVVGIEVLVVQKRLGVEGFWSKRLVVYRALAVKVL